MDRQIVYNGAIPLDTDQLLQSKNTMIGLGMLIKALLGTSTLVDGLACTPTGPASLQVLVGPGSIYAIENVDGTAYGSLAADTTHQIMKQGISLDTLTLNCPAPGTTGQSINYLIEVAYQDTDAGSTVLPYYNSSNPAVAYNGPNNSGTSQNTVREGQCIVNVKAGVAATTGSQTTPAPNAGFTGLWVVTVANGQTTITSPNIALAAAAPFISEKLGDKVSIPTGDARWMPIGGNTGRTQLIANTSFYVTPTGNDSTGTGTSGAPWATIQHAFNVLAGSYDLAGFVAKIKLNATGTYAGATQSVPWVGGGSANVVVEGDTATPSNTLISDSVVCLAAEGTGCGFTYQYLKTTSTGNFGINGGDGASLIQGPGVIHGACTSGNQIGLNRNATLVKNATDNIAAGAVAHLYIHDNASLEYSPSVVTTLTGTPAFSGAFAIVQDNASLFLDTGSSFSGAATGTRYSLSTNGVINTGGGGASFIPGSVSGTSASGGQYV
jgi:hypothetical protein